MTCELAYQDLSETRRFESIGYHILGTKLKNLLPFIIHDRLSPHESLRNHLVLIETEKYLIYWRLEPSCILGH